MQASEGFPPIATADARILLLGSLPGQKSLAATEYYAHPRNAFWPIMGKIFGIGGDYQQRCAGLVANNIALWDVLRASVRPGSLDADIRRDTAIVNDFSRFLREHPQVVRIAFNGRTAQQLFMRRVPDTEYEGMQLVALPSTSPAYAAMPFSVKLTHWEAGLDLSALEI